MWDKLVSLHCQCSPLVKQQLDVADYSPPNAQSATEKLKTFTTLGNTRPIHRDSFIPTTWGNNPEQYLSWSWFTDAQLKQLQHKTVTGFKEMHGDNVHRHHRFHNRPGHCLYLAIHCRWNSRDNAAYGKNKPIHLFVWNQSITHIRRASMANGVYSAPIYYRRAEDICIEFVPEHNGQEAVTFNLMACLGPPIGV
eukprot:6460146-Amphidinium_carterae.5